MNVEHINKASLGAQLRASRVAKGWTPKTAAEKMGLSPRYLADIERGDKVPKLETLVTILNVLEASADIVLQDSLHCGYKHKLSSLESRIQHLTHSQRALVIDVMETLVSGFCRET
ncbi:helix-turn-helix domain-containing protein [Agathobaculum sp.]|uniref:helix-turn-helix domain-containing protein n=1 Tax=Agathobaculum sp. TaxID=2048138 RepID=UPI002A831E43|nr:helix-turn-helix transcriptional regulator [Agathobaculum sp.]MDY3617729.1 helix-turn-helix transcriptional regulator [Agathobaculum sp.]